MNDLRPEPETIDRLGDAVFPALAMLAGIELDVFTPLKDGPLPAEAIADAIGVGCAKLRPLLYALVGAGLLTVDGGLFSTTPETSCYLVRDSPSYLRGIGEYCRDRWTEVLKTAESIRTGVPQAKVDFSELSQQEQERFFHGLHSGHCPRAVIWCVDSISPRVTHCWMLAGAPAG